MNGLEWSIIADLAVLIICALVLLRHGRLAHSHPGVIYLVFHVLVVTFRQASIAGGASTLFSEWGWEFWPVSAAEIQRAVLLADVALIVMTVAWLKASRDDLRKYGHPASREQVEREANQGPRLSLGKVWFMSAIIFPIGIAGLVSFARLPVFSIDPAIPDLWDRSAWLTGTQTWSGLVLMLLTYVYGFVPWLSLPMVGYLLIMVYQGSKRFRVIIPVLLLTHIYLDRHQLRWPSFALLTVLAAAWLLFFPLKAIGNMAQDSAPVSEIAAYSGEVVSDALRGEAGDQQFLDQFASALTLIDNAGKFYYGRTYLALVTLPIPRPLWPDKPGLADYLGDFSTPSRPMKLSGMIVTYLGESYANFGYLGILLIPFLLAYGLGRAYFYAYRQPYDSIARMSYVLIVANLILVYRDGLTSIVVFTLVNMMPLVLTLALHLLVRSRPRMRANLIGDRQVLATGRKPNPNDPDLLAPTYNKRGPLG